MDATLKQVADPLERVRLCVQWKDAKAHTMHAFAYVHALNALAETCALCVAQEGRRAVRGRDEHNVPSLG